MVPGVLRARQSSRQRIATIAGATLQAELAGRDQQVATLRGHGQAGAPYGWRPPAQRAPPPLRPEPPCLRAVTELLRVAEERTLGLRAYCLAQRAFHRWRRFARAARHRRQLEAAVAWQRRRALAQRTFGQTGVAAGSPEHGSFRWSSCLFQWLVLMSNQICRPVTNVLAGCRMDCRVALSSKGVGMKGCLVQIATSPPRTVLYSPMFGDGLHGEGGRKAQRVTMHHRRLRQMPGAGSPWRATTARRLPTLHCSSSSPRRRSPPPRHV